MVSSMVYPLLYLSGSSQKHMEALQQSIAQLRLLVEQNQLGEVFQRLKELARYSEYQVTVSLLLSSYNEIKKEELETSISDEEVRLRSMQLKKSVLQLLDHINNTEAGEVSAQEGEDMVQITLAKTEEEFKRLLEHKLSNKYTNLRLLSSGDNALIYKAERVDEVTNVPLQVAIKVIKPLSVIEDENIRNIREDIGKAKRLSNFDGMIRIIDEGLDAPPRYIVTEFVDGLRLSQRLSQGWPYRLKEIRSMLQVMARALWQGHRAGLVHNNIWPSNILVDKNRGPKLSPFQVVRASYYKRTFERLRLFAMYWSPEQVNTDLSTALSDQYSFGLVAFELFTGDTLYRGHTILDILRRRLEIEEDPSIIDRELKNTLCPPFFIEVIKRMLQRDPDQRFLDMEAVMEQIESMPTESDFEKQHPDYPLIRRLQNSYNRCSRREGFYKAFYDYYLDQSEVAADIFDRAWMARKAEHSYTDDRIWNYQYRMIDLAVERLLQFTSVSTAMNARLQRLVRDHDAVGVNREEYALFLECLKDTIYAFDEENWPEPEDLDTAWGVAVEGVLKTMRGE